MSLSQFQTHFFKIKLLGQRPWLLLGEGQHTYCYEDPVPGDSFPHPFVGR